MLVDVFTDGFLPKDIFIIVVYYCFQAYRATITDFILKY